MKMQDEKYYELKMMFADQQQLVVFSVFASGELEKHFMTLIQHFISPRISTVSVLKMQSNIISQITRLQVNKIAEITNPRCSHKSGTTLHPIKIYIALKTNTSANTVIYVLLLFGSVCSQERFPMKLYFGRRLLELEKPPEGEIKSANRQQFTSAVENRANSHYHKSLDNNTEDSVSALNQSQRSSKQWY